MTKVFYFHNTKENKEILHSIGFTWFDGTRGRFLAVQPLRSCYALVKNPKPRFVLDIGILLAISLLTTPAQRQEVLLQTVNELLGKV